LTKAKTPFALVTMMPKMRSRSLDKISSEEKILPIKGHKVTFRVV